MDVIFLNSSVFDIPPSRRVGALVHDGAADLQLWPGPGTDRELRDKYGPGLQRALDVERRRLGPSDQPFGSVIRIHPGKLHCDFLAWLVTRGPEPGSDRQPAPDRELLETSMLEALRFCAARNVQRVAVPALGDGPNALPPEERVVSLVETARRYEDQCFQEGKPPVIEELLVCESSGRVLTLAKRQVARLVKTAPAERGTEERNGRRVPKSRSTNGRSKAPRAKAASTKRRLDPGEVEAGRQRAVPYDRTQRYGAGQWVKHSKFGLGRVEQTTVDKKMELLFESGELKTLIHDRT